MQRLPLPLIPCLLLAPALAAQGEPWVDGEILVRSILPASQTQAIYRIEPETGHGEELISGFYWLGNSSSMAFDPYRQRLFTNMGLPPEPLFNPRTWLFDADGSAQVLPQLDDVRMSAVTPIGDGRVYYQDNVFGNGVINYLDENDVIHTLMDASGTAPFDLDIERMLYHAPTNAMLATTSTAWSSNDCNPTESSIFRFPLSADGSRVTGPVTCASLGNNGNVMSLDYLPGGDVFVQMSGGQFYTDTLKRVDPMSLNVTTWAQPQQSDMDGAVWCARIGKAIVLDDVANELRLFDMGQADGGMTLVTDVPVSPNTTGFSPVETLIEIERFDPGCAGVNYAFGTGLAGTGGLTPTIDALGCADVGNPYSVRIENVVGGGLGVLAGGFTPLDIPLFGGTLYLSPAFTLFIIANGPAGAAGAGSVELNHTFGSPSFIGLEIYFQAGFVDPGGPEGVSLTGGLLIAVG